MLIWDLPIRLFHWLLALSFLAAYVTAKLGAEWMDWHFRAGYLMAGLLLFRLAWGLFGSETARFAHFVRGPRAVIGYLRGGLAPHARVGHNPAGGWMVLALLVTLAGISVSGFFADDLILFSGPLAACVSSEATDASTRVHLLATNVALGLIGLHLLAIAFYTLRLHQPLVRAMVTGRHSAYGSADPPRRVAIRWALMIAAVSAALTWSVATAPLC